MINDNFYTLTATEETGFFLMYHPKAALFYSISVNFSNENEEFV